MFGIQNYSVFIISGILLNLTPGADTMYILGRSISQGRRAGILSVLGIITGALIHTLLVAFGLSVIFRQSEFAFNAIKYLGATYLGFLGVKFIIAKSDDDPMIKPAKNESYRKIYLQGLLTNLLNPKVALFYLAFLPQFVAADNHFGALPFLILGLTFITTGTLWCLTLAVFSSYISEKLRQNKQLSNVINKIAGVLFIGLGLNLLRQKI
jgi:RhtB (resistance to homoserine/threonine) family protein